MTGVIQTIASIITEIDSVLASGQGAGSITPARMKQLEEDFAVSASAWSGAYIYLSNPPYSIITDGSTDQTSVFQSALTAAGTLGSTVVLPLGPIVVNGTGVSVPDGVSITGQGDQNKFEAVSTNGSWIISPNASYGSGSNAILQLAGHNTLEGFAIFGAGSDGFGGSTSRPNIQVNGNGITLHNVSSLNGNMAMYCNLQSTIMATDCAFSCSTTGIHNPVDSHFNGCYFSSNKCDVQAQSGAASNGFINCRFEFNGSGASVQAGFNAPSSTTATSSSTASGAVLHFTNTSGITVGYQVFDQTAPTAIPAGAYVVSIVTNTSATLNVSVSSTVGSGDTIEFFLPNVDLTNFTGCQFDRCFTNALQLTYCAHWVISGCNFRRPGAGATQNTSDDAAISIKRCNAITIVGCTFYPGVNDGGGGTYSPSFGFWDNLGNYLCLIKNNTIVYNPVDGTHGGGINSTTNFSTFNSDNLIAQANPTQHGYP